MWARGAGAVAPLVARKTFKASARPMNHQKRRPPGGRIRRRDVDSVSGGMPSTRQLGVRRFSAAPDWSRPAGAISPVSASLPDEAAARPHHEPGATELCDVLAEHLPGLRVADVVVERPMLVRNLAAAVSAPNRPEQRLFHAGSGTRSCSHHVRWPDLRAGACAEAPSRRVVCERVERTPVTEGPWESWRL